MIIKDGQIIIPTKWFKHLFIFIFEAIIVLSIVIFGIDFFNSMSRPLKALSTADSMAIANSFMVYVTFIFVIVTVAITLIGIYFSRWWSREKKQVLSDNWSEMLETIKNDGKLMQKVKEDLLNESLEDMMKHNLELHKEKVNEDIAAKLRKMELYIEGVLKTLNSSHINAVLNEDQIQDMSKSLQGEINA